MARITDSSIRRIANVVRTVENTPLARRMRRRPRAAGGGVAPTDYLVRVRNVGGDSGGAGMKCTFTYDVYPHSGEMTTDTRLMEDAEPLYGRTAVGKYVVAANDTHALADKDPDNNGAWRLLFVYDEVPDVTTCDVGA